MLKNGQEGSYAYTLVTDLLKDGEVKDSAIGFLPKPVLEQKLKAL